MYVCMYVCMYACLMHNACKSSGTLTCNIMDFRKATINGVCYGEGITEVCVCMYV